MIKEIAVIYDELEKPIKCTEIKEFYTLKEYEEFKAVCDKNYANKLARDTSYEEELEQKFAVLTNSITILEGKIKDLQEQINELRGDTND